MTIDPELRQMLLDARQSRANRPWPVRVWNAAAEWLDIVTARFRRSSSGQEPRPKGPFMIIDDLRHALRRITSKPGTALACIGMLALAIGVTAAMFTVADHMLLRPAPFRDAAHLKRVWLGRDLKSSRVNVPADIARSFRGAGVFSEVGFFGQDSAYIEGVNGLTHAGSSRVSPGAFEMLGVVPIMGRTFAAGDGRSGTDDRIIIAERLWRASFGADPHIVGRTVMVSGAPATVIGVMPEWLRFPSESTKVWRPYDIDAPPAVVSQLPVTVYARVAPGVPDEDAARIAGEVSRPFSKTPDRHGVVLRDVAAGSLDDYSKTAIRVLLAGVGLVFLVLCANATNLILARTAARRQEFGVCSALGAARIRLIRQVLMENALIGAVALAVGLAAAWALVTLARSFLPEAFLIRTLNPLALDARAFGMAGVLAVFATLTAGLPPALIGTRLNAADSIRLESRGSSESRLSRRWTQVLLVGEVALASALLVGAGVLLASFLKLTRLDSGMATRGVTTMWVTLPDYAFKDRPSRAAFAMSLQDQVRSLPGVNAVTLSFGLPPDGGGFSWGHLLADGVPQAGDPEQFVFNSSVTSDFFGVYGIRMLEGRTFSQGDGPESAVISDGLAKLLWPGQSPIGHTFKYADSKSTYTVIGVVNEIRSALTDPREDLPEYYVQLRNPGSAEVMLGMRCDADCPGEPAVRERVRAASPQAVLYEMKTLESAYLEQFARPRAAAGLAVAFAVISVLAAAGGLFSILTYAVSRRRREFGVRAAMGAQPAQLRGLILKDGLVIAVTGLAIGGALTVALNKTLQSLSFGITAAHPAVWLTVTLVVCAVTLLAAWRPSLSAMRSDPIALLRDN